MTVYYILSVEEET